MSNIIEKSGFPTFVGAFAAALQHATAAAIVGDAITTVICDATIAAFTLTLPSASLYPGRILKIKQNLSVNLVTVAAAGTDTVAGIATYVGLSAAGKFVELQADGTNWVVLANN